MLPEDGASEMEDGAGVWPAAGAADATKGGGGVATCRCCCCCCGCGALLWFVKRTAEVIVTPGRNPEIWVLDVTLGVRRPPGWPLVTAAAAAPPPKAP